MSVTITPDLPITPEDLAAFEKLRNTPEYDTYRDILVGYLNRVETPKTIYLSPHAMKCLQSCVPMSVDNGMFFEAHIQIETGADSVGSEISWRLE